MTTCGRETGNEKIDVNRDASPVMCIVAPLSRIMRRGDEKLNGFSIAVRLARIVEATRYGEELEYSITAMLVSLTATLGGRALSAGGDGRAVSGRGVAAGVAALVASNSVRARFFIHVRKLQELQL